MFSPPSSHAIAAGLLAAFVGFASSFAVVVQGLTAVGASPAQAPSGLMALSLAMGLCSILVSLRNRMPISIAWTTPGAALLAASGDAAGGNFALAVGAFMICNLLIVIAGLWKPLGRWVAAIPAPLANAMLAGVLLPLCLAPVKAVAADPWLGLPIVLSWALMARWKRLWAVPVAVLVAVVLIVLATPPITLDPATLWPRPVLVLPEFSFAALAGIALPLFIVTMASQNIPGYAVLQANGYHPDPSPLFRDTGLFSLAATPFGAISVNLAAITAAICAGPEADPDPKRRYWAATVAGLAYVLLGLGAGLATAFLIAAPPLLIQAVAGLALLGSFGNAMMGALADARDREAAVITFLVAASGLSFHGIGGAFWGLLAGGAIYALSRSRKGS
ncbi:benzoate/H(+) symporter BenE family transporter [Ferrovibrio sp.]|uniref:benzoate/H(+) symporter BenE family transporter n=1 Tax=Ferrovibrio sp. TaxID=1917215 RepID=UPI001B56A93C|nr:benzoate/H(+) symporter BenE family transporter [Ferrovibrio sp.]MBP7065110.1 benzoate/H(+) symporter BenE family transporter [Ferrovibrio sp.]